MSAVRICLPPPQRRNNINFNEYQEAARKTAIYDNNLYPVLGLAEEAGEVAGKVAKSLRDKTLVSEDVLTKELGDVLWMVAAICSDSGISLGEVAQRNLDKLASRQIRGTLSGAGDER